jgi:hypothetical protein
MHDAKGAVGALIEEEQDALADRELRVGENPSRHRSDLTAQLPDRQRGLREASLEYLLDGQRDVRAQIALPVVVALDVGDSADDHCVGVNDQVIIGRGDHHAGAGKGGDRHDSEESEQGGAATPCDA